MFSPTADISAIHNADSLVYTMELPELLRRMGASTKSGVRRWLVDALMYVPTWDRIETRAGDSIYGLFTGSALEFVADDGKRHAVSYRDIAEVHLDPGGFFADAASATIKTLREETVRTRVAQGELTIDRFGATQTHKLRNLRRIVPGVARVRHHFARAASSQGERTKMRPMRAAETASRN